MIRVSAVVAWVSAFIASLGAGLFNPLVMAAGGIGAAAAALVWGYFARDDRVRWRFNGERYDEHGYTGEISFDDGATWQDESPQERVEVPHE